MTPEGLRSGDCHRGAIRLPQRSTKELFMLIDCGECTMKNTAACDDCIVTFLLDRPEGAVVFDVAEERALRVLGDSGLAPPNRFQPAAEAGSA